MVTPCQVSVQVYKGALWARTPTEMLEDGVLGTRRIPQDPGGPRAKQRDRRPTIGGDGHPSFPGRVRRRRLPSVVIEISAKLLHSQDQAVVGSRIFRHAQPAAGIDVGMVADAFSQALGATSRDIAGWVLVTGQAHEASHPHTAR